MKRRTTDEMHSFFMRDMKDFNSSDSSITIKQIAWTMVAVVAVECFNRKKIEITTDNWAVIDGVFYPDDCEEFEQALAVLAARNVRIEIKHKKQTMPDMLQDQAL